MGSERAEQAKQKGHALSQSEIVAKLNTIPVFVVLNGDNNAVSIRDESSSAESIFWHIDPGTAKAHLDVVIAQSPSVPGLHLGAMSLGVAFPLAAGWAGAAQQAHAGDAGRVADVQAPTLRHAIVFPNPVADVTMPIFLCDQLQTPMALPIFFDRRDLALAWVASGRKKEDFVEADNLMVVDLRRFIDDLQTDKYALWSTVQFVPSGAAVAVLKSQQKDAAQRAANGDDPPALASS